MPKVKMPDGVVVAFPDDMPKEEISALIAHKFPKETAAKSPQTVQPAGGRPTPNLAAFSGVPLVGPFLNAVSQPKVVSGAVQGASGVNEGLANMVGAPVDLATAGINLGTAGVNALAHTNIPQITTPFGGSESIKSGMNALGITKPPSADPDEQVIRRVGQEVGSVMIPGGGVVAKAAKPLATAAGLAASTLASGAAAGAAEQVAPGNQWVELAAELAAGFTVSGATRALTRQAITKAAPTVEELHQLKDAAYKQADALGVKYSPSGYQDLVADVKKAVAADHISATRHPAASSFVADMATRGQNGLTLTELDQLRQEVRRDLLKSPDAAEQHFGEVILDQIDTFIAKAGGSQVAAGSGADANKAILLARELNTRMRKTEVIDDALYAADLKAASTGSGGNQNNAIRQALRSILTNPKKARAFSQEEIRALEDVVKQGKMEDFLRWVGKASPGGNGLTMLLHLAGTAINPAWAAVPAAGMVAKGIADAGTLGKTKTMRALIAGGPQSGAALRPSMTSDESGALGALTMGQAANQNALGTPGAHALRVVGLN